MERRIYGGDTYWPDLEKVNETLLGKGVPVHRASISKEMVAKTEDGMSDWWEKLAFKLCGMEGAE